ncbi:murein DD-endopeptidase [Methylophilaceae bacterium]|nr:murein DD-endopeptidase [Methylophilaceae bacterium]
MLKSKTGILAQKANIKERKLGLRWLLGLSTLPLFGIYAAFAIAPQTALQEIEISTVIEEIILPEAVVETAYAVDPQNGFAQDSYWQVDQVRRDDTLASLMRRLNITNNEAIEFLRVHPDTRAFSSQLRPGRSIRAELSNEGDLRRLEYEIDRTTAFIVERGESGYIAYKTDLALQTHNTLKSAEINSSLFAATDAADIPDQIAIQIADIFSSEIDFHSDLRKGDRFNVVYESLYNDGQLVKTGQVLAAEFTNQGKTHRAVMYRNPEGQISYYTPEGKSLHKSFLRSPLEFSRISSGFSMGRFHPILQKMRAHKGVDYAAPTGTGVKASSDGVVDFVGVKGGYGNVIILKHQNGVSTVYGHLSRFASGLRKGMRVSQSQLIGYVGMTGMATGPHLHYELLINGQHRDPLKVALPAAAPIAPQYRADFFAASTPLVAQLQLLNASSLASIE